ncbi:hypothetical protein KQX54_006016 [Cotesia glomerata]|uniref:Uncharacterized protein n=1 Tax=Cotesia glomerata TaxID=32391 RepID=A0AAV7IQZ2_COTGL|nr:hypothetical protein KQX54_006016 [Cotesia glomerata]
MTIVVPVIENVTVKHYILDTDYYSYVIYYACVNDGYNGIPAIWVKTRDQFPRFSVKNVVQNALRRNGFPYIDLTQTWQGKCY